MFNLNSFKEGERVFHAILGPGTVVSVNDPLTLGCGDLLPCIRVQFDAGRSHRYGKLWFDRYPFSLAPLA